MSGIRKYRRTKSTQIKRGKSPTKASLWDILLIVGVTMALFGGFQGTISYRAYAAGMPEHISNTKAGTIVVPEEAPGNPGRKASAMVGFAAAGVGILLTMFALVGLPSDGHRGQGSTKE
jgi:hypothetical protein